MKYASKLHHAFTYTLIFHSEHRPPAQLPDVERFNPVRNLRFFQLLLHLFHNSIDLRYLLGGNDHRIHDRQIPVSRRPPRPQSRSFPSESDLSPSITHPKSCSPSNMMYHKYTWLQAALFSFSDFQIYVLFLLSSPAAQKKRLHFPLIFPCGTHSHSPVSVSSLPQSLPPWNLRPPPH